MVGKENLLAAGGTSFLVAAAHKRLFQFVLVGGIAACTDFTVFDAVVIGEPYPSHVRVLIANSLALLCATLVGYLLNRRLTYRGRRHVGSLPRYAFVAAIGAALYDGSLMVLLHLPHAHGVVMLDALKLLAIPPSAAWNYFGFGAFVFPPDSDQTPLPAS
jgi:putative flippase GtrA